MQIAASIAVTNASVKRTSAELPSFAALRNTSGPKRHSAANNKVSTPEENPEAPEFTSLITGLLQTQQPDDASKLPQISASFGGSLGIFGVPAEPEASSEIETELAKNSEAAVSPEGKQEISPMSLLSQRTVEQQPKALSKALVQAEAVKAENPERSRTHASSPKTTTRQQPSGETPTQLLGLTPLAAPEPLAAAPQQQTPLPPPDTKPEIVTALDPVVEKVAVAPLANIAATHEPALAFRLREKPKAESKVTEAPAALQTSQPAYEQEHRAPRPQASKPVVPVTPEPPTLSQPEHRSEDELADRKVPDVVAPQPHSTVISHAETPRQEAVTAPAAKPEPAPAAAPAALPEKAEVKAPLRNFSLEFTPDGAKDVRLHVSQHSGDVHVSLHSTDATLSGKLRDGVQELFTGLDKAGYEASSWNPSDGGGRKRNQPDADPENNQNKKTADSNEFESVMQAPVQTQEIR